MRVPVLEGAARFGAAAVAALTMTVPADQARREPRARSDVHRLPGAARLERAQPRVQVLLVALNVCHTAAHRADLPVDVRHVIDQLG